MDTDIEHGGNGQTTPLPQAEAARQEYARLPLLKAVALPSGAEAHEVVIYRPRCGAMMAALDTPRLQVQIERFVDGCCKGINGSGPPEPFNGMQLSVPDGSELAGIINAMSEDADKVVLDETGDGVTGPLIYNLKCPILYSKERNETVSQFEFLARTVGEISEYLDARGETREFTTFMRTFGKPLGLRIPVMTDGLLAALDFLDYLVIRRQIMPRFISSRGRWKRVSLLVH